MYGDTNRGGATTALRFVTCDLSSLTDCGCVSSAESDFSGSSSKRKNRSKPSPLIDPEILTPLTAKRLILERPSLIDRLIYQNKSALEEMEGKKRGPKRGPAIKVEEKENKRKRTDSMNGTSPAIKRLRSSKGGSDSESSESRNTSTERRGRPPSSDKGINKKPSPKKMLKKSEKSRFSKRIVFSTSSLRSGKKRKEFMKRKRIVKSLTRESKDKKKWAGVDKTDSNSNVCTENDSNDEGVDDSTDSEMSRGTLESSELMTAKHEPSKCQEDVKKRRKRRKRDSMWVQKVKRKIKAKAEVIALPPALSAEAACKIDKEEEYESSDALEESDIPVLNKESDESINLSSVKEPVILNNIVPDDVTMPKLEKEVEIEAPTEKTQDDLCLIIKSDLTEDVTLQLIEEKPSCEVGNVTENEVQHTASVQVILNSLESEQDNSPAEMCLKSNQEDEQVEKERHEVNQLATNSIENALEKSENINENTPNSLINVTEKDILIRPHNLPEDCDKVVVEIIREPEEELCDKKPIIISSSSSSSENLPCPKIEKFDEYDPISIANLKEEILELEPNMFDDNSEEVTDKEQVDEPREEETDTTKSDSSNPEDHLVRYCNKTDLDIDGSQHKVIHMTMDLSMETKDVSLLDADSTSDVKPQTLDDSFTDFSLRLPDDLELDSSPSDEDRGEESDGVFPDSTENGQHEESSSEVRDIPIQDNVIDNDCSGNLSSLDNVKVQEIPEEKRVEITKETNSSSETSVELSSSDDNSQKVLDPVTEVLQKEVKPEAKSEELTTEQRQMKESVLQALGLKSLAAQQPEEKPKRDGYTGTLKAVIKLNRSGDKKRMVYQRTEDIGELEYRICSEIPSTDGVPITHLNDISGIRKNVAKLHQESDQNHGTATSNGDSEEHDSSNHDDAKGLSGAKESNLIIPEKSSSFSIHPTRLCSDVCSYCFGKFGCLDTPCHVAQLKAERQKKILENEPHLTAESCLCDACYRYVDRKACPSKSSGNANKTRVKPPTSSQCCVNLCGQQATHTVKKKWLVKLKKSITNKLDIDLDKPGAMYFPLCAQHHYWVDYFTVCGICRKRLNRNHLYSLGSETDRLNLMLAEDGIPARLSDKLFLCKLCRYYSNLRLKYSDPGSIPSSGQIFYRDYRRKILMSLDISVSDSEDEHAVKEDKKKGNSSKKNMVDSNGSSNGAASSNKSEESVMSLSNLATLLGEQPEQQARIQVKFGNVNIGRLSNLNIGQGGRDREERLPYSDVGLQANLEFQGPAVPDGSWERCVSTIQFDKRTKKLWQDLQKPYGNQSSFLRHLVMLEKYWRAGYLTLAPGSDERATKYLNGVKNRIKAFEGSSEKPVSTQSAVPVSSSEKFPLITNTGEIEVTPIKTVQKKPNLPQPEKKHLTPLDRAKALVRMVPPPQRFPMPMQRYPVPMYVSSYGYSPQHRPPPLLKIRNKPPHQFYHQIPQSMHSATVLRPILPKLPKALTVTQVPQSGPAITLNRSGITIEKQSGSPVTPSLPIEKPSISVFREPAPGPS